MLDVFDTPAGFIRLMIQQQITIWYSKLFEDFIKGTVLNTPRTIDKYKKEQTRF